MPPNSHDQKDASSDDSRYFPRWEVNDRRVECRVNNFTKVIEGRTKDLSVAGACVVIGDEKMQPKESLRVKIELSEEDSIDIYGHVAWTKPVGERHEIGIAFGPVPAEIENLIFNYAFEINKEDFHKRWFDGIE